MSQESESLIGQLVGGRFKVLRPLGEGGMGVVVQAQHQDLGNLVAIKVLKSEFTEDERMVGRFRREARAASRIHHPNIVFIQDFGQLPDGRFYLVMEYVPGVALDLLIRKRGPLSVPLALKVLIQVAEALEVAHNQTIVHRDLKPENILLTKERDRSDVVKILDFGLAKILEETEAKTLTLKGQIFGTPEYMSPEQCMGHELDYRSDIYSFGVLAFELVVGDAPFSGSVVQCMQAHCRQTPPRPSQENSAHGIPVAYDELVSWCLSKKPEDRPPVMGRILEKLKELRTSVAVRQSYSSLNELESAADPNWEEPTIPETDGSFSGLNGEADSFANEVQAVVGDQEDAELARVTEMWEGRDSDNESNESVGRDASPSGDPAPRLMGGAIPSPQKRLGSHVAGSIHTASQSDFNDSSSGLNMGSGVHRNMDPREVGAAFQRRYRNHLKSVVGMVLDNSLGSPGLALSMSRLLDHEEELYQKETEIALLESQTKEVDEAARQRVNQLRRAVIDLSQERERLAKEMGIEGTKKSSSKKGRKASGKDAIQKNKPGSKGSPQDQQDMFNDITYQISVLEGRLMEVTKDREKNLASIEKKLAKKRQENYDWEARLMKLEGELTQQLQFVRDDCQSHPVVQKQITVLDNFYSEMMEHSSPVRR